LGHLGWVVLKSVISAYSAIDRTVSTCSTAWACLGLQMLLVCPVMPGSGRSHWSHSWAVRHN